MDYIAQPKDYWIAPNAINITRNALGKPNRVQCSVASGAVILCYIEGVDGLGYDNGHRFRTWPLTISPTYFNSNTEKYVYVAIPRSVSVGTRAVVVFPSEKLDIYGVSESDAQVGSTNYYYIWLQGIITATDGTSNREWQQHIDFGRKGTDEDLYDDTSSDWYQYSKVSEVVTFLKNIAMKAGTTFQNLILGYKELTGVATSDITYTDSDTLVATPGYVESQYLSKTHESEAQEQVGFLKGLWVGVRNLYEITANGIAKLKSVIAEDINAQRVQTGEIKSPNYTGDGVADTGFRLTNSHNGHSKLTIDELYVRMKAVFESLEVRERTYTGGDQIWSCAGNRIIRVDYLGNVETADHVPQMINVHADGRPEGQGQGDVYSVPVPGDTYGYSDVKVPWLLRQMPLLARAKVFARYRKVRIVINEPTGNSANRAAASESPLANIRRARCYFLAKDDDTEVHNWWRINDLARCQTMNLANTTRKTYLSGEDEKAGNIFWWRKVIGVSYAPVTLDDGKQYHYFDVAFDYEYEQSHPEVMATSVMEGSDIPAAQDSVVQFGNTIIEGRMNLMMMEVNGSDAVGYNPTTDAPCLKAYRGIYCFDLNKSWVGGNACKMKLSPKSGYEFYGPNFKQVTEYDVVPVPVERGLWTDITPTRDDYREHAMVRKCYYYDKVSRNGSYWLCSIVDGAHWVDGGGNYLSDSDYSALTEEQKALCSRKQNYTIEEPSANSTDWTEIVQKGATGRSGIDGDGMEYVFIRTKTNIAPQIIDSPSSSSPYNNYEYEDNYGRSHGEDNFLPIAYVSSGKVEPNLIGMDDSNFDVDEYLAEHPEETGKFGECTDDAKGTDSTWRYEWVMLRKKGEPDSNGVRQWQYFSGTMKIWNRYVESSVRIDLDNEIDTVACDADGKVRFPYNVVTRASIFEGATRVTSGVSLHSSTTTANLTIGDSGSSCSPVLTLIDGVLTVTWSFTTAHILSDRTYRKEINLVYKGVTYTTAFTLGTTNAIEVYQLAQDPSALSFNRSSDGITLTPPSLAIGMNVKKTDSDGSAIISTPIVGMKVYYGYDDAGSQSLTSSGDVGSTITITNALAASHRNVVLELWTMNGNTKVSCIDREVVPIVKDGVKGADGTSPYFANNDNKMDSVVLDKNGNTTSQQRVSTNVYMYYGQAPVNFIVSVFDADSGDEYTSGIAIDDITVVWNNDQTAGSSDFIEVTFANNVAVNGKKTFRIVLEGPDDVERELFFIVNGIKPGADGSPATIYNLLPSMSQINVGRTAAGGYSPSTANLMCGYTKNRGGIVTTVTNAAQDFDGYAIYFRLKSRTSGWLNQYYKYGEDYTTYLAALDVAVYDKVEFIIYDATEGDLGFLVEDFDETCLVDRETVPVVADGIKGDSGDAAPFYESVWYAWSNVPSTQNVYTSPFPAAEEATAWTEGAIPENTGSLAYLWRKSIKYTYDENYAANNHYSPGSARYVRVNGDNGTSIHIAGSVVAVENDINDFPTTGISNGDLAIEQQPNSNTLYKWSSVNGWVDDGPVAADGDAYVNHDDGHLWMWSNEASAWVPLGPFKGQDGLSSYVHFAWCNTLGTGTDWSGQNTGFTTVKANSDMFRYMGVLSNNDAGTDPDVTHAGDYTWNEVRGVDAVDWDVVHSENVIRADGAGTVTTGMISVTGYKVVGGVRTPVVSRLQVLGNPYKIQYSVDGGVWSDCQHIHEGNVFRYVVPAAAVSSATNGVELRLVMTENDNSTVLKSGFYVPVVKDGEDGIVVSLNPSDVIITQSTERSGNVYPLEEVETKTIDGTVYHIYGKTEVKVVEGGVVKTNFTIGLITASGCQVVKYSDGKTIGIYGVNAREGNYVSKGYADIQVIYGGQTYTVRFNFYCNLLGTWKRSVEAGVETIVAGLTQYLKDENGNIITSESLREDINDATQDLSELSQTVTTQGQTIQNHNTRLSTAEGNINTVKKSVRNVNLLKGLEDGSGWTDYESFEPHILHSFCVFLCENGMNVTSPIVELPAGTYTASAYGWDNESQINGITLYVMYLDDQGGEQIIGSNRTEYIQGGLMKHTFTLPEPTKVFIRFFEDNEGAFSISEPKIEAGTEVTEWEASTMSQIRQTADNIELKVKECGINIDDKEVDLTAGKVNFKMPGGGTNPKISIDPTTGTLHAVDGKFSGNIYTPYKRLTSNNISEYETEDFYGDTVINLTKTGLNIQVEVPRETPTQAVHISLPKITADMLGCEVNIFNASGDVIEINGSGRAGQSSSGGFMTALVKPSVGLGANTTLSLNAGYEAKLKAIHNPYMIQHENYQYSWLCCYANINP